VKITSVSVGLRRTESLPGYSNVAPSINLTAEVEEGEEWLEVKEQLTRTVNVYVETQIDDALEAAGQPPKYYQGPRFTLLRWKNLDLYVIVPDQEVQLDDLPGEWRIYGHLYDKDAPVYEHQRLEVLRRMAAEIEGCSALEIPWSKYDTLADWAWDYIADRWVAVDVDVVSDAFRRGCLGTVVVPCSVWRESILCDEDLYLGLVHLSPIGTRENLEQWCQGRTITIPILETSIEFGEWVGERLVPKEEEGLLDG
jgi:hypothetical protein